MSELRQDVAGLQHSLLFLQQEHAKTLHSLHQEIAQLQRKCSGLAFQLTVNGLIPPDGKAELFQLESQEDVLQTAKKENAELRRSLESKDKRVVFLEDQLRSREVRYQDDMRNLQRKIAELDNELENRSATVAYLTTQLQSIKFKASQPQIFDGPTGDGSQGETQFAPVPPAGNPVKGRNRSVTRTRSSSSPVPGTANVGGLIADSSSHHIAAADAYLTNATTKPAGGTSPRGKQSSIADPPRPAVGHSQARRERELRLASNVKPKPADYEDFIRLSACVPEPSVVARPFNEPLPPIASRSDRQLRATAARLQSRPARRAKALTGEIEQLVVESIASPDKSFMHAQDS